MAAFGNPSPRPAPRIIAARFSAGLLTASTREEWGVFEPGTGAAVYASNPAGGAAGEPCGAGLVALRGCGASPALSPRLVRLWDTDAECAAGDVALCERHVVAVRCNAQVVALALTSEVRLYRRDAPLPADPASAAYASVPTSDAAAGVLALTGDGCGAACRLACAAPRVCAAGEDDAHPMVVYDLTCPGGEATASASPLARLNKPHRTAPTLMEFGPAGDVVATASCYGTIVRLWRVPDMSPLCELRRGSTVAALTCLAFSPDGSRLAAASDTGTVHVFEVAPTEAALLAAAAADGDGDAAAAAAAAAPPPPSPPRRWRVQSLLPAAVSRALGARRSFLSAKLKSGAVPIACALCRGPQRLSETLAVLSSDGVLYNYCYTLDVVVDGCRLVSEHEILKPDDDDDWTGSPRMERTSFGRHSDDGPSLFRRNSTRGEDRGSLGAAPSPGGKTRPLDHNINS